MECDRYVDNRHTLVTQLVRWWGIEKVGAWMELENGKLELLVEEARGGGEMLKIVGSFITGCWKARCLALEVGA